MSWPDRERLVPRYDTQHVSAEGHAQAAGTVARTPRGSYGGLPDDAAQRKQWPLWTYLTQYFPDAFLAVVRVAWLGNEQHNPGEPMHWARGKSPDQLDTAMRHMWDHSTGRVRDTDGAYHLAKAIWRLSAELQLTIEKERGNGGQR